MQVATQPSDLHEKLALLGWTVGKIDFKNGVYVARANSETGQSIERTGKSPENALAAVYTYAARSNQIRRYAAQQKVGAWKGNWLSQLHDIGHAYAQMPAFDQKAVEAYKALAAESKVQADAIKQQIKVDVVDDADPYPSAAAMQHDIHQNKHLSVSRAGAAHPLWSQEDAINFRIVRDVLGHASSGADYTWHGTNMAAAHHMPMLSPQAREALFTETVGRSAYDQTHRGYAPTKVGLLNDFLHPVQAQEGEHVFVPHGGLPELALGANTPNPDVHQPQPGQLINPNAFPSPVMAPTYNVMNGFNFEGAAPKTVSVGNPHDPNAHWLPEYQGEGNQEDWIDHKETRENAAKIDTQWQFEDLNTQRKAIMNAFRVALLSPRKHLRWNAAHYQGVMHTDPSTKARDLWDVLESEREKHNQALGHKEGSHLAYRKNLAFFAHVIQQRDPSLSLADAYGLAKDEVFKKTVEFEDLMENHKAIKNRVTGRYEIIPIPEEAKDARTDLRRYNSARALVTQWMKDEYSPPSGWRPRPNEEQTILAAAQPIEGDTPMFDLPELEEEWPTTDATGFSSSTSKYGAFMGGHLDAIEQVGKRLEDIRQAALHDLEEDGGRGFYFRNAIMNMNLKGVNPKVASFVWLLLAPLTSELGIIDTHIARGLGVDVNDVNPRDYYKYERMQRSAKDATGYKDMPLGQFHWGMWDAVRNPGEHSDHSPLRILDPLPWDAPEAKWDAASNAKTAWREPAAWGHALASMAQTAQDFDRQHGLSPQNKVPDTRVFQ